MINIVLRVNIERNKTENRENRNQKGTGKDFCRKVLPTSLDLLYHDLIYFASIIII